MGGPVLLMKFRLLRPPNLAPMRYFAPCAQRSAASYNLFVWVAIALLEKYLRRIVVLLFSHVFAVIVGGDSVVVAFRLIPNDIFLSLGRLAFSGGEGFFAGPLLVVIVFVLVLVLPLLLFWVGGGV